MPETEQYCKDTEMIFKYLVGRPFYFNNQRLRFEVTVRRHASIHWPNLLDEPIVENITPTILVPHTSSVDRACVKPVSPSVNPEVLVTLAEPSLNIKQADLQALHVQWMDERIQSARADAAARYKATLPVAIRYI